jgi:hypothetical protein
MKVRSAILTEMSGKLGGAVASRARGDIQYFRKLVTPSNPDTTMQKASRQAITSASAYWKSTFNDAQREVWWDLAEGAQTGQSLFTKINQPRFFATNANRNFAIDDGVFPLPPVVVPPASLSTILSTPTTITIDDSANQLTLDGFNLSDPWIADSGPGDLEQGVLYVYLSHEQVSSRLSRQHPFQLVRSFTLGGGTLGTSLTVSLAPLGFTSIAGEVMYVKLISQAPGGGISTALIQRVTIVA